MTYDQNFLDELRETLPQNFWRDLEQMVNKGRSIKNRIALSTIKDTLRVSRQGKRKMHHKDKYVNKNVIIEKAIELKKSKGMSVPVGNNK